MMVVGTLSLCPWQSVQLTERRSVRTQAGLGHSRARQANDRALRSWRVTFKGQQGVVDELDRLWRAAKGTALYFNWTPPGGTSLLVRFAEASLRTGYDGMADISVEVVLEEVR